VRPARVTPVATRYANAVHSYHAIPAWSPDGGRLLYLGIDDPTQPGEVVVRELDTGRERVVGSTGNYNFHTAAWQMWALGGKAVLFGRGNEEGEEFLMLAPADGSGPARELRGLAGCNVRRMCRDGRRGTGHGPTPRGAAIQMFDLRSESGETLVTLDEALALYPEEFRDPAAGYGISHAVANDQETRLFFKVTKYLPGREISYPDWGAFYVKDLPGGELRCLGYRISGHPIWLPDGRHILNIKNPLDGSDNRWVVRVDSVTGRDERLFAQPTEGPGHPALSPDGRWLLLDGFTADGQTCPIYLFDMQTGLCREIARLRHLFRGKPYGAPTRGQPHPTWSPDGRKALVNCNDGGARMGLYILEDFLP
jgi:Tol biopolymer transport system component